MALGFATSYIPTTSAQVTRAADVASMTGTNFSSWYNFQQGTMYADFSALGTTATVFDISDGSSSNFLRLSQTSSGTTGYYRVFASGTQIVSLTPANALGTWANGAKEIASYQVGSYSTSVGGGTVSTTSTSAVPLNINQCSIGKGNDGTYINGRIKKLAYYPQAVTSAQLQALTGT